MSPGHSVEPAVHERVEDAPEGEGVEAEPAPQEVRHHPHFPAGREKCVGSQGKPLGGGLDPTQPPPPPSPSAGSGCRSETWSTGPSLGVELLAPGKPWTGRAGGALRTALPPAPVCRVLEEQALSPTAAGRMGGPVVMEQWETGSQGQQATEMTGAAASAKPQEGAMVPAESCRLTPRVSGGPGLGCAPAWPPPSVGS